MEALNTKVITGKVRLSYAHIWDTYSHDGGDEKFSVSILIPKNDKKTIAKVNQAIENATKNGKAKFGGKIPANLKTPMRDGDIDKSDIEEYENCYFVNCTSKTRPGIVDKGRNPIMDQEEVFSGCYAIISINMYPFNSNGNKGIAAGLNNIMKVADGEPLGGRISAEQDFAEVDFSDIEDEDLI